MSALRKCRRALAFMLIAAGLAFIAGPIARGVETQVSAAQAKDVWKKWKQAHAGRATDPAPGEPVCWLRVPSCKISTLVMQESTADALHRYPAARELASGGSVVLAHRDLHFRGLGDVRVGDEIKTEAADGHSATYTVRTIRVLLPEQLAGAVNNAEDGAALHLVTCYPFHYLGAAPKRFLVTAIRSGAKGATPR